MTFQLLRPEILPPEALDALLASGWYRMRQSIFTCRYLLGHRGLHSAVWTRLPLMGYHFKAGLRRRMNRVGRDFEVSVLDGQVTAEHEALYGVYVDHVGGDRVATLHDVLYDDDRNDRNDGDDGCDHDGDHDGDDGCDHDDHDKAADCLFVSHRVEIRHQNRLVAYSFFDSGRDSLQSVIGVYDPEFARYGLGIATLLEEIRFGLDQGFRFHYSGYVVPGVPAFDYKRDVGDLQYYDKDNHQWRLLSRLDRNTLPAIRLRAGLDAVGDALTERGLAHRLRCYPPYRVVYMNDLQDRCMSAPLFIECGRAAQDDVSLIVSFAPTTGTWTVEAYQRSRDLSQLLSDVPGPDQGPPADLSLLVRLDRTGVASSADQAALWVARALARGPWEPVDPD